MSQSNLYIRSPADDEIKKITDFKEEQKKEKGYIENAKTPEDKKKNKQITKEIRKEARIEFPIYSYTKIVPSDKTNIKLSNKQIGDALGDFKQKDDIPKTFSTILNLIYYGLYGTESTLNKDEITGLYSGKEYGYKQRINNDVNEALESNLEKAYTLAYEQIKERLASIKKPIYFDLEQKLNMFETEVKLKSNLVGEVLNKLKIKAVKDMDEKKINENKIRIRKIIDIIRHIKSNPGKYNHTVFNESDPDKFIEKHIDIINSNLAKYNSPETNSDTNAVIDEIINFHPDMYVIGVATNKNKYINALGDFVLTPAKKTQIEEKILKDFYYEIFKDQYNEVAKNVEIKEEEKHIIEDKDNVNDLKEKIFENVNNVIPENEKKDILLHLKNEIDLEVSKSGLLSSEDYEKIYNSLSEYRKLISSKKTEQEEKRKELDEKENLFLQELRTSMNIPKQEEKEEKDDKEDISSIQKKIDDLEREKMELQMTEKGYERADTQQEYDEMMDRYESEIANLESSESELVGKLENEKQIAYLKNRISKLRNKVKEAKANKIQVEDKAKLVKKINEIKDKIAKLSSYELNPENKEDQILLPEAKMVLTDKNGKQFDSVYHMVIYNMFNEFIKIKVLVNDKVAQAIFEQSEGCLQYVVEKKEFKIEDPSNCVYRLLQTKSDSERKELFVKLYNAYKVTVINKMLRLGYGELLKRDEEIIKDSIENIKSRINKPDTKFQTNKPEFIEELMDTAGKKIHFISRDSYLSKIKKDDDYVGYDLVGEYLTELRDMLMIRNPEYSDYVRDDSMKYIRAISQIMYESKLFEGWIDTRLVDIIRSVENVRKLNSKVSIKEIVEGIYKPCNEITKDAVSKRMSESSKYLIADFEEKINTIYQKITLKELQDDEMKMKSYLWTYMTNILYQISSTIYAIYQDKIKDMTEDQILEVLEFFIVKNIDKYEDDLIQIKCRDFGKVYKTYNGRDISKCVINACVNLAKTLKDMSPSTIINEDLMMNVFDILKPKGLDFERNPDYDSHAKGATNLQRNPQFSTELRKLYEEIAPKFGVQAEGPDVDKLKEIRKDIKEKFGNIAFATNTLDLVTSKIIAFSILFNERMVKGDEADSKVFKSRLYFFL